MDTQLKEIIVQDSSEAQHPPMEPPSYPGPPCQNYPGLPTISYSGQITTGIINTQPMAQPIIMAPTLGHDPYVMTCSFCHQQIATRVEKVAWFGTHFAAGVLCLMLCWPCVFIPYCTNVCKKAVHYCPRCNSYLGTDV